MLNLLRCLGDHYSITPQGGAKEDASKHFLFCLALNKISYRAESAGPQHIF